MTVDAWDAIRSRRQVRSFTDQPLPDEALRHILEAGRRAPSARNTQPWDFVVVRNPEQKSRLCGVWQGASWIGGAAAVVAIVLPTTDEPRKRAMLRFDAGQAAMQMTIAAAGAGVGSGQSACEDQALARDILGFPEGHEAVLLIGLGYPADRPLRPIERPNRRAFDDVVHLDRW